MVVISEIDELDEEQAPKTGGRFGTWMNLMGDDLQMKIINQDDSSSNKSKDVEAHDAVVVDFVGRCASDRSEESGEVFHEANDWMIMVGDKDVTPALEMGIRFMKEGERSVVYSHSKFAYGPMQRKHGSYELPPNSNVVYHIHVKSVISDDNTIASPKFQLQLAKNKKSIGNDVYANEWSNGYGKNKALLLYKKAGEAATNSLGDDTDAALQEDAKEILIDALNNTAAVYMRAKEYGKAKESATLALMRDPNNLKALLRAAKAAMLDPSCSFEESSAAIVAAEEVDADDADVRKLRVELQLRKRDYKAKSKEMMVRMSQAMKVEKPNEVPPDSKTTLEKCDANEITNAVHPTNESENELDRKAQKLISFLPFVVQFIILIAAYFWIPHFSGKTVTIPASEEISPPEFDQL